VAVVPALDALLAELIKAMAPNSGLSSTLSRDAAARWFLGHLRKLLE
jgi:hypothetical protein